MTIKSVKQYYDNNTCNVYGIVNLSGVTILVPMTKEYFLNLVADIYTNVGDGYHINASIDNDGDILIG